MAVAKTEKQNFSNEALRELFDECNKRYFNNTVPTDLKIEWSNRMTRVAGQYSWKRNRETNEIHSKRIALSIPYHQRFSDEIIDTLVHEMIHAKYPNNKHGDLFQMEMRRINKKYRLNVTQYSSGRAVVNYIYQCTQCNHNFERSKSLDTNNYKCSCGGELKKIK